MKAPHFEIAVVDGAERVALADEPDAVAGGVLIGEVGNFRLSLRRDDEDFAFMQPALAVRSA